MSTFKNGWHPSGGAHGLGGAAKSAGASASSAAKSFTPPSFIGTRLKKYGIGTQEDEQPENTVSARPLKQLKDPASFPPPPKHKDWYPDSKDATLESTSPAVETPPRPTPSVPQRSKPQVLSKPATPARQSAVPAQMVQPVNNVASNGPASISAFHTVHDLQAAISSSALMCVCFTELENARYKTLAPHLENMCMSHPDTDFAVADVVRDPSFKTKYTIVQM